MMIGPIDQRPPTDSPIRQGSPRIQHDDTHIDHCLTTPLLRSRRITIFAFSSLYVIDWQPGRFSPRRELFKISQRLAFHEVAALFL